MRRKMMVLIFVIILSGGVSGCRELLEVERRAFATTIGIDLTSRRNVLLSVQIPLPQRMLPLGSSGFTAGGKQGKIFNTITLAGQTVHGAFDELQTETYQKLVIQQNKGIIIGEEAARQGVRPLLDFLIRSSKSSPQTLVMIAHDYTAREVLEFEPSQQILPGDEFIQSAQILEKYDRTYFIPIWRFMQRIVHQGMDTYAPLISLDKSSERYILAGVAVFNGDRLAGMLNAKETEMFGIIAHLMKAGRMTFALSGERMISLRNVRSKTEIKVTEAGGKPFVKITMRINGAESETTMDSLNPAKVRFFEREIADALKPQLKKTIRKLQRFNSDVISLGEELRAQHPELWKTIDWKKTFPTVPVKLEVKVKIKANGVIY